MHTMNPKTRNRLVLVALFGVFALPLIVAWTLSATGWRPGNIRSSGTLVQPPRDVSKVPITLRDGSKLAWQDPHYRWTLLALPGSECASACRTHLEGALRMRLTLGQKADRLRVVYIGPNLPEDYLSTRSYLLTGHDDSGALSNERAKGADQMALALVDPRGLLMMHYASGYSAQGLRSDIKKVLY